MSLEKTPENMKTRKLALVLLDIVGSTGFVQRAGPILAARILQHHDRIARSLCYKNNGREIDRSDGFLMSFESVQEAVKFSLDYNKFVTPKIKLRSRIGIHWGAVVEIQQLHVYVDAGAKRIELEGIAKNIAARTMSLALPSQILLTVDAFVALRKSVRLRLPANVRTACVGIYKFKGVREPMSVYAIAVDYQFLQPPPGNEKAIRLGGPKHIKKLARDKKLKDYLFSVYRLILQVGTLFSIFVLYLVLRSEQLLSAMGIIQNVYWIHFAIKTIETFIKGIMP
jgi:class 3 adenylate cyclase